MALDPNLKLAIQAKLKTGTPPKDVAKELDVKLPTVYAIQQKMQKDKENELVQELHSTPEVAIAAVVEKAKSEIPQNKDALHASFVGEMEAVAIGADGLKKLDRSFQTTMTNVLRRFDALMQDDQLPLKDIVTIANTTANAYEKVFTSGTNIHIGDNNSQSNTQLTMFKNKQGV